MEQKVSTDSAAPSTTAVRPTPPLSARLHALLKRYRAEGLWGTMGWMWRVWFPRITGIPLLSDGQIKPLVYIGPQYGHVGRWKLRRAGIRHVINLREESDDAERGLVLGGYCHLPTPDEAAPSMEHLWRGITFIGGAVERREKVYIHCKAGRGRAPTMAAAYVISRGVSMAEALKIIHQARRSAKLTPAQLAQLEAFCQALPPRGSEG